MLDMLLAMTFVFGGFGIAVIGYTIVNVFMGMILAIIHMYNGGHCPMRVFLDWMKYI